MAIANKGQKLAPQGAVSEATDKTVRPNTGVIDLTEKGKEIYNQKSAEEQASMGSKSDDIEFMALITNPWYSVTRTVQGKPVKGEETVGALLKNVGQEPITVAVLPNKSYKVMDIDFEKASTREIAPGEQFQLNSAEVAELLTRDEYASTITGGGKVVTYTTQAPKDPAQLPTTKLRLKDGSVKDHSVSIADVSPDGKTKTIKPDFAEKFEIFSTRGTRRQSVSGSGSKPKVNAAGLAVQALFKSKLGGK